MKNDKFYGSRNEQGRIDIKVEQMAIEKHIFDLDEIASSSQTNRSYYLIRIDFL